MGVPIPKARVYKTNSALNHLLTLSEEEMLELEVRLKKQREDHEAEKEYHEGIILGLLLKERMLQQLRLSVETAVDTKEYFRKIAEKVISSRETLCGWIMDLKGRLN